MRKAIVWRTAAAIGMAICLNVALAGVARADDCSTPLDCEQTAGYAGTIALAGGAIAVATAVIASRLGGAAGEVATQLDEYGRPIRDFTAAPTERQTVLVDGENAIRDLLRPRPGYPAGLPIARDLLGNPILDPNGNPYVLEPTGGDVNVAYEPLEITDPITGDPIMVIDPDHVVTTREITVPSTTTPGLESQIYSGDRAIDILMQSGLARRVRLPDGTEVVQPTDKFDRLEGSGTTMRVAESRDAATNEVNGAMDVQIRGVSGVAYETDENGNITSVTVIVYQTQPGNAVGQEGVWDVVTHPRENVEVQGDQVYVDRVGRDLNTLGGLPSGQTLLNDIGNAFNDVRIRQVPPGAGNHATIQDTVDAYREADGTANFGSDVTISYDPTRTHIGDGSEAWHNRPAEKGLGHELVHARDAVNGELDRGMMVDPGNPGTPAHPNMIPVADARAVGLGPFAGASPTENTLRADQGITARIAYTT